MFRRTLLSCLCLAGLSIPSVAFAVPTEKEVKAASRHVQKGDRAMKSGDVDRAKESYAKGLKACPGFPGALIGLGHVAMAESRFEDALESYTSAKGAYKEYGEALFKIETKRYGDSQKEIGELRDSMQQLSATVGSNTQAELQLAQLNNTISRLQAVQPPDRAAMNQPPGELDFYIGNAKYRLNDLEGATAAWERCRDKQPEFPMVYNNLALAYWQAGRLDEARASLDKAEELGFPVNSQFRADLEKASR
jgi:tetratricopeptide (TPR) repeat protein